MRQAGHRPLVIAIGNEFRCDDSAALIVARRLRALGTDHTIIENTGDCAALLDLWDGADTVLLLDAVRSGAPPGTIHQLDIRPTLARPVACQASSHSFDVVQAVELGRVLGKLPRKLTVYGIEGERFVQGTGLSSPVQRAVEKLTTELISSDRCNILQRRRT